MNDQRPLIAVGPTLEPYAVDAVRRGGGTPVGVGEPADGLVWLSGPDIDGLRAALDKAPDIRWVQLPSAGVEHHAAAAAFGDGRVWTCAKGSFAEPVAEHALLLALAGLRDFRKRMRATAWDRQSGTSLYDGNVTVLGGGGIAQCLLDLLAPFRVHATVVRRRPVPMRGAERVVETERLHEVLPGALVVFVALALTPETTGIISAPELALMDADAWLVNVARGRCVDTGALVEALRREAIGGAALDVTDPEPLPEGHPFWSLKNCVITPHTADTPEMIMPLLAERIAANVARFAAGEPLEGLVDPGAGY